MKATLVALVSFLAIFVKADIVILQYGDIQTGKILATNETGVDILQKSGKIHWPASMVKDVRTEADESTANRIPSWVKILSQLTTNDWEHDVKQIPATVIDNGILKNVPYISFRCNTGGYELNIYGDLDDPACVEIGAVGYNAKRIEARTNCLNFIASVLTQEKDKNTVLGLDFKLKDVKKLDGNTFEITLPDEEDSYGGWWVSIYNEGDLDKARASVEELASITQPKVKPKAVIPVAVPTQATAQNYWSDNDISSYARPSYTRTRLSYSGGGGGSVYVHSYYRKNGTYVSGYTRHSPRRH